MGSIEQISVEDVAQKLATEGDQLQLIDVREDAELELAKLEGFQHFPLSQFSEWSGTIHQKLEADKETLVLCHHGMRSAQMCQWLMEQGFTNVKNILGGIDAYAVQVDRAVPRY